MDIMTFISDNMFYIAGAVVMVILVGAAYVWYTSSNKEE